ncbi:hypothetical protein BKP37_01380 [Anaerobacillus alkalilacustris]|uniref:Rhodanese domain-containing protein n=1 Tax=Anaerobacillus alkalilacustris TaxID=393763 RepID=A0A1S2LXH1_9BACI|nr:rhodanese-like domain-containing protein [Anaerobacillus alkalilacustris]OIJ17211.1 hypothetical protein BKP37_01380 [Anaerobacillus alkalilacustris]
MYKRLIFFSINFFILLLLGGCTKVAQVPVDEPIGVFGGEVDVSLYVIEVEPSQGPEPVELEEHLNYIDTEELMRLVGTVLPTSTERSTYDQYTPEWGFVLIDSRPPGPYKESHINGAINMPDGEFDRLVHLLPENKETMLIFYCGGLHCHLSPASANKALELGYTNVWVYQEGTPFWKSKGNYFVTTPEYVGDLIMETYVTDEDSDPYVIFDARTYNGYFNEHIPGGTFPVNSSEGYSDS